MKWRAFELKAVAEAESRHSSSSDPTAGETLHPSFKLYYELRNKYNSEYPSNTVVAKKNREKRAEMEASLGVRPPSLTGEVLTEVRNEGRRLDRVVLDSSGSAEVAEVVATTKWKEEKPPQICY